MKRTIFSKTLMLLCVLLSILAFPAAAQTKTGIVATPLAQDLVKLFPDLSSGYIDFSGNGKPDQTSDLNEYVPESRVRDGQLQAQEILDFIIANWRFISLDKLKAVKAAVKASPGAISELIAIDYGASLDEALSLREQMGDGLYLTPSAYREAMEKMGGIVTAMVASYKKEGPKSDAEFTASRDSLFAMIDKGYPLPLDLPVEEKSVLSTSMVSVILKEKATNPARTRTAIRVLALVKSTDAAPYLAELAAGKEYPIEAMKALGEIGYKAAIPVLAAQLKTSSSPEVRKAALNATGVIGGAEGLDTILDIVKPANRESLTPELFEASAQALAGIAQKGNTDLRIQTALRDLAAVSKPAIRRIAAGGLGAFNTQASLEALTALVNTEKDVAVRKAAVAALALQKGDTVMGLLLKVIKERDLDPALKSVIILAIGDNPLGAAGIPSLVESLADPDANVRTSARNALLKLAPANQALVTGALSKALLASSDESFLAEGTTLASVMADAASVPAMLVLLGKPFPEVKRIASWALYRIRSQTNPKVPEELQNLVTNENETIAVRVNAVRALGAIGLDSATLNVWETLVTTAQMRGEKYAMLRFYSVRALGELKTAKPQAIAALVKIASRDPDMEMRKEAVFALKSLPSGAAAQEALSSSFLDASDVELKVRIIEALSDLGSDKPPALSLELLGGSLPLSLKRRIIVSLSENPTEAAAMAILDGAKDADAAEFITAVLEGFPKKLIASVVSRRLRTESDKNVLAVLTSLDILFSD